MQPDPIRATAQEQVAILTTIFAHEPFEGPPPPPPEPGEILPQATKPEVVLLNDSVVMCSPSSAPATAADPCVNPWLVQSVLWPGLDAKFPKKLRQELLLANSSSGSLPAGGSAVTRIGQTEAGELVSEVDGWRAFYARFPKSGGLTEASWAVLSTDGVHALIYVGHRCGGLCGKGRLYYLERTDLGWKIIDKEMLWIS